MTPREKAPRRGPVAGPRQRNQDEDIPASSAVEDPDGVYRRRLTDDEVRAPGYSHRDKTSRWVHRRELALGHRVRDRRGRDLDREVGARRCLTCGIDPHHGDHLSWCDDATPSVGAALRDARDLEAAIAWQQPELDLPKLTDPERQQLATLFDALVRAREQARGETAPKLWTIKEWLDTVAGKREDTA